MRPILSILISSLMSSVCFAQSNIQASITLRIVSVGTKLIHAAPLNTSELDNTGLNMLTYSAFLGMTDVYTEANKVDRWSYYGIRCNGLLKECARPGNTDELRAKLAALRIEIERAGQQIPLNALEGSQ